MNIREKFEELVRSTKLKLSRDNKEYNKIYDSNDINKNVLSKYSKEELISNKDKLREFLVSQDMIDNLSQEELKELISHLDYEDIKDIVFFSKLKMSNDKTTSFLSFLNEEDLAKYILERGEASLSIFNNNYELLKPLIDDGTIFDIFNYDVVSVILNTMLYMNDYEYIIGLLGNSKIITNFSSSFVENLATSYFINYDVFKDINIDKTLPLALSGKQLASFYSTWHHKDDYYKEWQSQQEKEKEEMGESDAYNVKYFLESQKIEKEMLGRFIERFGLNFNKSLFFLNHVEIFSMSPEEDKIETLTKLFPAFMEQYNGKSFNEIFNIELKKCKDIYSIGDIVENYDEYLVRDLEELPLDKEILDYLTMSFLQEKGGDIVKRFFYSQLIKYAEEKYNISVKKSIYNGKGAKTLGTCKLVENETKFTGGSYNASNNELSININDFSQEEYEKTLANFLKEKGNYAQEDYLRKTGPFSIKLGNIQTVFHEMRHAKQDNKCKFEVSLIDLIFSMEKIISKEVSYFYKNTYNDLLMERDARNYGYYDTYKFLESISKNQGVTQDTLEEIFMKSYGTLFTRNRKRTKLGSNVLKERLNFLFDTYNEEISEHSRMLYRYQYPSLRLIYDVNGKMYDREKICVLEELCTDTNTKIFYRTFLAHYDFDKPKDGTRFIIEDMLNGTEEKLTDEKETGKKTK